MSTHSVAPLAIGTVSPLSGLRGHLKPWAMIHAKRFALLRNIEIASYNEVAVAEGSHLDQLDPIQMDELAITGGRDEGNFVVWEVQDGAGWIITVSADFMTGQVTVEA